jgi:amidophosphoribosyltransferase
MKIFGAVLSCLFTNLCEDLVAHGRTNQQIADYIGADQVIFQDLDGPDGLKAACMEAAEDTSKVTSFETGVFSGCYVTEVPEGYFEHLSDLRSGKRKAKTALTSIKAGGDEGGNVVVSSGPTNGPEADEREDIRSVSTKGLVSNVC